MKIYIITALMISSCSLPFSCKKKTDNPPATNYGTIFFWTKNSANLAACSNNISIMVSLSSPYGYALVGTAQIINVDATEPILCSNIPGVENLTPGITYYYLVQNCATGQSSPAVSFTVSSGECLKIEIP